MTRDYQQEIRSTPPGVTVDGVRLEIGQQIWVWGGSGDRSTVHPATIKEIHNGRKVLYTEPDADGYIGARNSACFSIQEIANEYADHWA